MKVNKEIIRGGAILIFSVGIFSFLGFIFQLFMARNLSIVDYGLLAALFSIIYIFGFFTEFLQTLVAKYSSTESDMGKTKHLLVRSLRSSLYSATLFFGIYLIVCAFLYTFLNIPYLLLAFNGLFIFAIFLVPITRGILQGKKQFFSLGATFIIEGIVKLGAGVAFVYMGLSVFGAVGGAMLGTFLAFLFSLIPMRPIISVPKKETHAKEIKMELGPTFIIILTVMVFYSIDVVIARIVFTEDIAGMYSIASILSKTIFWITQPISKVILPVVAQEKDTTHGSKNAFISALVIVLGIAFVANLLFYLFDSYIVQLFSGRIITASAEVLPLVGLAMSFISLANLVLLYKLSRDSVKGIGYLWMIIPIQILTLVYFSSNLIEFSLAYVGISIFFLVLSLIFSKLKSRTHKV